MSEIIIDDEKINNIPIYVISFKNPERKKRILERFNKLNFKKVIFTPEVYITDNRITSFSNREKYDRIEKRTWSIMLQHLDSIRDFYLNTEYDVCIICEDDITISKELNHELKNIIPNFYKLKLDVLMLGYLIPFKIYNNNPYFKQIHFSDNYSYYTYPNDIWGSQMYMISRDYAKIILESFTLDYAYDNMDDKPFSSDWVITKNGNRALIYPMIAVEEGINISGDYYQEIFHKKCYDVNYVSGKFI